jgi:bifunctional non-homologous end joining protein LigD
MLAVPTEERFSTPHVWLARADRLNNLGLAAFVKTTGSRGLHVVSPLDRSAGFDDARAFARELAAVVAENEPDRFTVEARNVRQDARALGKAAQRLDELHARAA